MYGLSSTPLQKTNGWLLHFRVLKQEANFLLHRRIATCADAEELAMLQTMWNEVHRPKYRQPDWSPKQKEALGKIRGNVSYEDEDAKQNSCRFLYTAGAPGSGKSAVLLEAAVWAAGQGMHVLMICPTGQLVYAFKSSLPEVPRYRERGGGHAAWRPQVSEAGL